MSNPSFSIVDSNGSLVPPNSRDANDSAQAYGARPTTIRKVSTERRPDIDAKVHVRKSGTNSEAEANMSTQDRHIDARLTGIESKIDARMDAMQQFQEQAEERNKDLIGRVERQSEKAESRFQRATERHETDIALARQQIHQEFKDASQRMSQESSSNRRHSTQVAIATVASVVALVAVVVTFSAAWMSEQGSYAKSFGETQVEIQRAADERVEFRDAVQAIQQTQQAILERLPASQESSPQQ